MSPVLLVDLGSAALELAFLAVYAVLVIVILGLLAGGTFRLLWTGWRFGALGVTWQYWLLGWGWTIRCGPVEVRVEHFPERGIDTE